MQIIVLAYALKKGITLPKVLFFFRKHKTHLCCKFSQLLTVTGAEELTSNIPDGRLTSAPLNINS